jgi:hypothetical protein
MMKMAALLLFLIAWTQSAAQQQDSTIYVNGIPVSEDDTVANFPQTDFFPKENHRRVGTEKIPSKLRKALDTKPQFRKWEQTGVYFDTNTKLYIVKVPLENGYRIFGLDADGKPVTFDEVSEDY